MPNKITYTIKTVDGKEHQVSKENIDKHGIQAYADAYEGATIRMRDSKKGDYDIPLANYNDAKAQGLHAFSWEHLPPKAQPQAKQQVAQKQPASKVNTTQGTPMTATQKAQVLDNTNNIIAQSQSDLSRTMRKFDYAKQNTGLDVKPIKLGENRKIIKQSSFNPQTGKKEESYLTESGNIHDSYANASTEQNAIDDFKEQEKHSKIENQLNAAYKERDSITKALQRRMAELDKQGGHGLLRQFADAMTPDLAMHSSPRDYEMDEEYGALMSAARKNNSTIQILEDKKKGRMNNFWSTLGATFSNGYTFTDGLSGVRDNIAILNANKRADKINRKRQRGEMLTNEEDAFDKALLANLVNEEIEGTYGQEYGALARAAKITAGTADVVKDFLLSGGTGITVTKGVAKGVMNAGAKYLTKKAGESLLKAGAKAFGRGLLKATGIGVGSLAGGALITNTTGIGKTAEEMSKQVTGRVGVDQHGNYIFTDSKDLMHAFIEAERSMIGENASEMLGEFIPGSKVLKKGLEKIGLSKISSYLTSIGNKSWAKNYGKLLEAAGWIGLPGDGLEEYAGIAYNSLTGDSEGGIATLGDARTHIDIWLGCAAAGALLGAPNVVALGANTAQYYRYKHATNKAAQQAKSQLTADRWNALQERIDNTENQDLTNLMLEVYTNKELSPKQKKAVFNYTDNLVRMRGYNIGSINNADATRDEKGEKELHKEENIGNAYATGYHATEDELANIKNELELRQRQLAETFKDDPSALQQIEEDPKAFLQGLKESEVGGEKAKAINAYEEARAAYDGMIQRVKDNIDDAVTENNTVIEQRTHDDGNIYSATMKLDDRKVYVIKGNVQMNEDGTGIDHEKSSSSVMVRDAETGKIEMVDPSAILSVDTPVNAEEEKATSSEQIKQTYAQEQANKIDGVLEFKAGDTYSILGEDQKQHTIQIIGEAIDEKTKQPNPDMVMASIDGLEPTMLPKEQIQAMNDEENLWRLDQSLKQGEEVESTTPHSAQSYNLNDEITLINEDGKPVRGSITTDQNEDGKFEVYTEEPINGKRVNLFTAEELDAMTGKQQEQTNQAPVQEEQGEPIYEQADPETAWDAILEQTEGDESIAQSVADGMVADMEAAVRRAEKAKVKGGTTIAEKIAAEKERVATIEQAKARLEHWKKIASTNSRRQEAIQAEESRKAKEAALLRKEQEEKERDKREEAQPQTLDYKLSDEVDENGHPFVLTSAGELAFGNIGKETGLAPAPILLSEGVITNSKTNAGYGLVHIEARHGEQIRNAGYPSVVAFVEEVAKHYDVIREGINRSGEQTYMLQLTDRHNNTLMVELSGDGTYYNINTAGIFKTSYGKNRREVYNRHTTDNQSTESGEESQGEAQSGTTSPSRMKSSTRSSAGKVSESSNAMQGNAKKTSENEATRVETNPTEAQKEAGNYKKGHIKVDGMNITIEQPKGSIRRGKDASGKEWESEMHNTYGYIRGTEGVDGDHIDIFLSDNPNEGNVFVVDQVNKDGSFDEHKVMYGFSDKESARQAYLSNYEDGWQGLGNITEVSKEEFKKWIGSSKRKTKPFAEYKGIIKSNKSVSSPVVMSEDEYLASKGLNGNMTDYMLDKLRIPHSETARQQKQREKEAARVRADFDNQKEEARKEYRQKIAKGELREPTKQEAKEREIAKLIKTANGHEDNPSVQAARRLLAKRGVDWRTDRGDTSDNDWLKSKEDGKSNVVHSFGNSASQNDTSIKLSDTSFAKMKNGEQKAEEEIGWLVDHNIRLKENSRKLDEIAHLLFDGDNIDSNRESALREEAKKILEENEKLSRDYQKNYSDKYFGTDDITANYILQEANERLIALGVKPVKESYYFQNRKNEVAQNAVVHLLKRIGIPVHFISRVGAEASGQGNSRGWTNGLDIWLTKDNINAETPVHEYTHIWTFALMKNNPKLWAEIKNLLKDSEWVDTIQSMDEYKYTLDNEDLLYSEVLSRISGERNGEKFESMAFKLIEEVNSVEKKVDLKRGLEKLRDALKRFWEWVGVNLFGMKEFKSVDDVCDRVLFDLLNASDIARTEEMREYYEEEREMNTIIDKAKEDGTYLKTPNGEDSKLPEKVWAYARTKKFKTQLSDRLNLILNESKEDFKDWEKEEFRDLFKKHGLLEENNEPGRFLVSQFMYSEKYYDRKGKMQEEAKETMNSGKGGENVSSVKSVDMTEEAKTFAKQHNLDASDVIAYKQAMEEGLLRDANNALSAIRRKLREENKGLSLSGFVKKFSPIREALYKQFGDLGVLEKEYHDNILKERGLMEAARKREEEERKRQNEPIEELMSMTSEERDAEYMRALEAKDEKRMFEVLQAEAKLKGYSMGSEYQGEGTWKAPSNPGYSSTEERRAALEKDSPHLNIDDIANGFMNWPEDISTDLHAYGNDNESGKESAKAISDAISDIKDGKGMPEVTVYRAVPTSVEEESLRNGDWVTPSKAYAKIHGESRLDGDYRIIEQKVPANELWWDGNDIREWGFDNGKDYAYKNTENSRKLNDLITRDDQGNVILPSQRFNEKVEDERFRNDEELEEVNQRFNEELNNLTEANADKVTLWLGKPSDVLLSSGIENKPLKLYGNKVIKKMKKHGFALDELRDLPKAVADPIAVFDNYQREGNRTILTELRSQEKNIMVAVTLGKNGVDVDFNIVSSVFGKGSSNVVDWISKGYLAYVDKEKALNYLYFSERNISEAADNSRLSSAANIVKSFENPINNSEKKLDRKSTQGKEVTEKERQQMAERANELAETLHLDNVEIVTDASTLEGKKAKAKGFYSTSTGKITIVIPNHSNIADVEKTLLHEAVAHHGLRKLFGEHFDNFLDNVFKNASEDVRREIVKLAAKNKWDFRIATEEYLASLAEDTNFEKMPNGLWDKVKRLFLDMLRSIGLLKQKDGEWNDNELRYILWRSYKNLKEKGQSNSILNKAEDIAMQHRLKVGNYSESTDKEVRFRDGEPQSKERVSAAERYEQRVSRSMFQSQEALQDSMLGLKEAMDAIMRAEGKEMYMEDIEGFENAYLGENRLSSVNQAETEAFAHLVFKPMLDEVAKLAKNDKERSELTDYMMAKHGLERNEVMRKNALEEIINNEKLSDAQKDARASIAEHRDYAGLTALTDANSVEEAESEAQRMVEEYEQKHDTTNLWDKVNAVTKGILSKSYECGMMNKQTYEKVRDMYQFYIPLRGFDEETSREAYAYLSHGQSAFNAPIKTAKGRSSKADDPFANMQSMAESAIMQGNRNVLVKQKFLNFALNHPSDLVSVNALWLKYDDVKEEWRPVFPDNIEETDTADEVEKKIQDFEQRMTDLAKQDPERYKHGKDTENIPYRIVESRDLRQHQVVVKRNGRDYVLTINGNPRAAQALNGLTNPDNDVSGAIGAILNFGEKINRQLSAFYTTRNPDFVVSNFIRDMLYANSIVWVKERPNYALRFHRNIGRCNPAQMKILLSKHKKGELDMNNSLEHMFHQFIMNGGETGYANVRDIEQHKNDIQRELKRANGKIGIKRSLSLLGEKLDEYNRAVENCARFAAFLTSREMGRTIDRSIYDAKDISVNFNKKGSGAKFMKATGQTKVGKTSAFISGIGRSGYVFWNAAIQGTTNFGRQFKRHPAKAFTASATMFILGALIAGMGMGDDGDDDKNSYWNLPESVRRSNILFRVGEQWISIPLPVEYRSIYGMGELMVSAMSGKEHFTNSELGKAIAGQVTQILPIDFLEGEGGVKAFVPSAVKPFAEVISNKGWTGMPIYKDTPYNKNMPEWTKTYKSANKYLVGLAKILNEKTGGDAYTKGTVNINPAQIEYLLNGYFGGVSNTIDKLTKSAETIAGKRDYDPKSFLLLNRVLKSGDERTEERAINREYYRLKEEYEILRDRLKNYENDTDNGVFDYSEKINFLYNSPEYARYEIFEDYRGDIESLYKELKEPMSDEERASLEAELTGLKKQMIEEMNSTRK